MNDADGHTLLDRVLSTRGWRDLPSHGFLLQFLSLARILTDVFSVTPCLTQCTGREPVHMA